MSVCCEPKSINEAEASRKMTRKQDLQGQLEHCIQALRHYNPNTNLLLIAVNEMQKILPMLREEIVKEITLPTNDETLTKEC